MKLRAILSVLAALIVVAAAPPLAAQQPPGEPVAYNAYLHVKPGMDKQFIDLVKKYDKPMLDKLTADGVVLAWGLDTTMIHQPGAPNYIFWFATADFAGLDKVFAGFEENEKKVAEDDKKAADEARRLRRPAPKTVDEQFQETIDVAAHFDTIVREIIIKIRPEGAGGYSWVSTAKVKPGKSQEFRRLFEKYNAPVLDKLIAEAALDAWGLEVEETHTQSAWTHNVWMAFKDLAARDKIRAAFLADRALRSPEERAAIEEAFLKITDAEAHRDWLTRVVPMKDEEKK